MFIAGIDGGGTHTRLEIRDEGNCLVCRKEFGPFNINAIGEDAFRNLLRQVFDACGDMADCAKLCIGGAGLSNFRAGIALKEEVEASGFRGIWKLCGDQEIALRGAMDTPGVAVIAGTGSICFGKNGAGETARSGGCGHIIDDGGSGYALGRDILSCAARAADGRGNSKKILAAVYEILGATKQEDIVSFVFSPDTDKAVIAKFAHLALEYAEAGEADALEILEREADELQAMVAAVQNRLGLEGCPIALLGGLISNENIYRRKVVAKLSELGTPMAPAHDALWGAAQMAWEL